MCRLVLMNKQGEREIDKIYGLDKYLKFLEKSFGGHGNGFAAVKNNKVIKYEKGTKLDVRDIAKKLSNTNYDWAIFHTRFASVGEKTDKNCHPFIKDDYVMAMNGTERAVSFLCNAKDITDTEAIVDVMNKYKLELSALTNLSSIFVGFKAGEPYVIADNTRNIKLLHNKDNNAIVFASEFPKYFKKNVYELKRCYLWNGGPINYKFFQKYNPKKKKYTSFYTFDELYGFDSQIYGQCYLKGYEEVGDNIAV